MESGGLEEIEREIPELYHEKLKLKKEINGMEYLP